MQTFPSIPGLYYVNQDHIRFVLRCNYVNAVVSTTLLSPYCVLFVRLRPHYDFFEHVQNSPASTKTIKIASRPYRFLLRSFYVVQVLTASKPFYIDVVGTWSSLTGVLAVISQTGGNSVTIAEINESDTKKSQNKNTKKTEQHRKYSQT